MLRTHPRERSFFRDVSLFVSPCFYPLAENFLVSTQSSRLLAPGRTISEFEAVLSSEHFVSLFSAKRSVHQRRRAHSWQVRVSDPPHLNVLSVCGSSSPLPAAARGRCLSVRRARSLEAQFSLLPFPPAGVARVLIRGKQAPPTFGVYWAFILFPAPTQTPLLSSSIQLPAKLRAPRYAPRLFRPSILIFFLCLLSQADLFCVFLINETFPPLWVPHLLGPSLFPVDPFGVRSPILFFGLPFRIEGLRVTFGGLIGFSFITYECI